MKKTILMFAAAGLLLATPSCKKGENDPALSLASRTARFAGTWDVSGYEANSKNTNSDGDVWTSSATMSGNVITYSNSYTPSGGSTTSSSTTVTIDKAEYVIEKDGSWTSEFNTTSVESDQYTILGVVYTVTTTTVSTNSSTGNWSFLGKVKDSYKKKERVVLNTLTSNSSSAETVVTSSVNGTQTDPTETSTYVNNYYSGEVASTYELDELKGKEMIWKTMESNSGTSSFGVSGGSTTTSTNDVYTADETWTFTIVK